MNGDDVGFVDVVSNLLGVLILLALFGLLVASTSAAPTPWEPEEPVPGFPAGATAWRLHQPFSTYYVVVADGVATVDVDSIARALAERPGELAGANAAGTYRLHDRREFHKLGKREIGRWDERDIDAFRLEMLPDGSALAATSLPGAPTDVVDAVARSARESGRVPAFLVYASGMNRFAELHHLLRSRHVRFRWAAFEDGGPLNLDRSAEQFLRHDYRR